MADAVSGATGKIAMGMFGPQPSITIVTFWQGIVEIVLRALTIVSQLHCSIEYMRECVADWKKEKNVLTSAMWLGLQRRVWGLLRNFCPRHRNVCATNEIAGSS